MPKVKTFPIAFGFTLIEVLVVIAIIGILAAFGLANYQTSQQKARDAVRKQDIATLHRALQLYYADNGSYPIGSTCCDGSTKTINDYLSVLVPKYIPSLPKDPKGNDADYFERYNYDNGDSRCGPYGTSQEYRVWGFLEYADDPQGTNICGKAGGTDVSKGGNPQRVLYLIGDQTQ